MPACRQNFSAVTHTALKVILHIAVEALTCLGGEMQGCVSFVVGLVYIHAWQLEDGF